MAVLAGEGKVNSLGKGSFSCVLVLAALAVALWAPACFAKPGKSVIEVKLLTATDAAPPGAALQVVAVAEIHDGYHINDHRPTLDYLIPTVLKWDSHSGVTPGEAVYPAGEMRKFAFSSTHLSVYQGRVLIGATLRLDADLEPGEYELTGRLSYQACTNTACLPPSREPFRLRLKVVPQGSALKRLDEETFRQVEFP